LHPLRKQRFYAVLSILVGTAVAALLIFQGLSQNLNLFYSPSEITKENIEVGREIRAGGMVKKGSVFKQEDSLQVTFEITDFEENLTVLYKGILPDLFSEDAGVVVKGSLNEEGVFIAYEVLAKHDENYMPPEVAKTLKRK
tara:strand:+ start:191 stop:613 length:423 start_codon:yes stop_codon:yes gene_type:complete